MTNTKKIFSRRGKKALRDEFTLLSKTLMKVHKNLREKLDTNSSLRDQEFRTIQNLPKMLKNLDIMINGLKEEDEEGLPEGKLKDFILMFEWTMTIGTYEEVIKEMDYYECKKCGKVHSNGRECMFIEYKNVHGYKSKPLDEDEELEDYKDADEEDNIR